MTTILQKNEQQSQHSQQQSQQSQQSQQQYQYQHFKWKPKKTIHKKMKYCMEWTINRRPSLP
jgi:hypothetical protein